MKFTYIFISLFLFSFSISAEKSDCLGDLLAKSEADQSFNDLSNSLAGITSLKSEFRQNSYLAALDIKEESEGDIWYKKPEQLMWKYSAPEAQLYLLKDRELRHYNELDNILTIKNLEQEFSSKIPLLILFGEQKIADGFTLEKACSSNGLKSFILKPKQDKGEEPIEKISLKVDSSLHVEELAITEKGGNRNIFLFIKKVYNADLSADAFELKFPANADVNDLRSTNAK